MILKWWHKLCMSIHWIFMCNEFMEYKRVFLLRCCNTVIVRFRAQLIAYREPLCKFEKGTPSEWCSHVGTWSGKRSLGWILTPFCPIGWVFLYNAQIAILKWQPQLLHEMCASSKDFKAWSACVGCYRVHLKFIKVMVPSLAPAQNLSAEMKCQLSSKMPWKQGEPSW